MIEIIKPDSEINHYQYDPSKVTVAIGGYVLRPFDLSEFVTITIIPADKDIVKDPTDDLFLTTATGASLDSLGYLYTEVSRADGETDEDFRNRLKASLRSVTADTSGGS